MRIETWAAALLALAITGCGPGGQESRRARAGSAVRVAGAMKNVMWKGELGGRIALDTLPDRHGLYGLGPESYLRGELLIRNGVCYVARAGADSALQVERRFDVSAPFFVYANVGAWEEMALPAEVQTLQHLEAFLDERTQARRRPFAFRLEGQPARVAFHVQNLPPGSRVSSPEDAHRGQLRYQLRGEAAEIVGFFSTEHAGIFTHHDSFVHMHLITKDERKMGHVDELEIGQMRLFLPAE